MTLPKTAARLLALVVALFVAIVAFASAKGLGWLSPLGLESSNHDSQVIQAIERTQEVSLLSLGIQGIDEKDQSRTVFGTHIPGTSEKVFLEYTFKAKLGLDGSKVRVTKNGNNTYAIAVPKFSFIGYSDPTFKTAAQDGGVLSWVTPDIDKAAMINKILGGSGRQKYIDGNQDQLEDQTKVFYDTLIKSVDPSAVTKYTFSS